MGGNLKDHEREIKLKIHVKTYLFFFLLWYQHEKLTEIDRDFRENSGGVTRDDNELSFREAELKMWFTKTFMTSRKKK